MPPFWGKDGGLSPQPFLQSVYSAWRQSGLSSATPKLAGVPRKALGPVVADLGAERAAILAALDLRVTGI